MRLQITSGVIEIQKRLVIAVTGTPGTGKSHFARKLAGLLGGLRVIEINDIVERRRLFTGLDASGTKIVKMSELRKALQAELKRRGGTLIVVGHLAADLDLHYSICVVTRSNLSKLSAILKKRRYNRDKIRENILAEGLDYCGLEVERRSDETYEVETQKEKREVMLYIKRRVEEGRARKPRARRISKMSELRRRIMNGKI